MFGLDCGIWGLGPLQSFVPTKLEGKLTTAQKKLLALRLRSHVIWSRETKAGSLVFAAQERDVEGEVRDFQSKQTLQSELFA